MTATWIFGYGSLVWRPGFDYLERRPAWVRGWKRRFWQGSTDHRGVPEAPGRVVTLLPDPQAPACWGMAYRLDDATLAEVVRGLDFRERGGYARHGVELHFRGAPSTPGTVYIAMPENRNYLGEAEPDAIARQIVRSAGPSGANLEYLRELASALRALEADDPHVFELEKRVERLQGEARPGPGPA